MDGQSLQEAVQPSVCVHAAGPATHLARSWNDLCFDVFLLSHGAHPDNGPRTRLVARWPLLLWGFVYSGCTFI